jgi:hypothetical protein
MWKPKAIVRSLADFLTFASDEKIALLRKHLYEDELPIQLQSGISSYQVGILRTGEERPALLIGGCLAWAYLVANFAYLCLKTLS